MNLYKAEYGDGKIIHIVETDFKCALKLFYNNSNATLLGMTLVQSDILVKEFKPPVKKCLKCEKLRGEL